MVDLHMELAEAHHRINELLALLKAEQRELQQARQLAAERGAALVDLSEGHRRLTAERDEARAELECAKAFHDVAVKERDEWRRKALHSAVDQSALFTAMDARERAESQAAAMRAALEGARYDAARGAWELREEERAAALAPDWLKEKA